MISARQDTAPEAQGTHQANQEWRGYPSSLTSTVALRGHQREHGAQGLIAIARRKVRMHGPQVVRVSCGNRFGFNSKNESGVHVGFLARNHNPLAIRNALGKVSIGDPAEVSVLGCVDPVHVHVEIFGHCDVPCFDNQHIGPLALKVKNYFAHSDKSSSAANGLGQESMTHGYGLHVAAADFPADAFLSRRHRLSARINPAYASNSTLMHTRGR